MVEEQLVEEKSITSEDTSGTANIIYILYLVGIVVGITTIVGLVIAYINKSDAPEWLKTHYRFQIRTFWISLLYVVIGIALLVVVVGWFILLFTLIWFIVRCVKGMKYVGRKEAYPNPAGWWF